MGPRASGTMFNNVSSLDGRAGPVGKLDEDPNYQKDLIKVYDSLGAVKPTGRLGAMVS